MAAGCGPTRKESGQGAGTCLDSHQRTHTEQRKVREVKAGGDGAIARGVFKHGADDLQHAEPLHPTPRRRMRHRDPPQPELLEARGHPDGVQVAHLVGYGGKVRLLEHAQRGARAVSHRASRGTGTTLAIAAALLDLAVVMLFLSSR